LFLFTDPATTAISTLSLHDALPIYDTFRQADARAREELRRSTREVDDRLELPSDVVEPADLGPTHVRALDEKLPGRGGEFFVERSEEHTSELQSRGHLVCRLLLEKK